MEDTDRAIILNNIDELIETTNFEELKIHCLQENIIFDAIVFEVEVYFFIFFYLI